MDQSRYLTTDSNRKETALKTLKTLLCTLLLLCGMSLAQQETVPVAGTMETHDGYSINLQNLSIVLNNTIRTKSGLIPFNMSAISALNTVTGGVGTSGNQHLGTYGSYSITGASPNRFGISLISSNPLGIQTCGDGTRYKLFQQFYITTSDGSASKLGFASGSGNITVPVGTPGTCSSQYPSFSAYTLDGSGILINASSGAGIVNWTPSFTDGTSLSYPGGQTVQTDANGNTIKSVTGGIQDSLGLDAVYTNATGYYWLDAAAGNPAISQQTTNYTWQTAYGCPSPYKDGSTTTAVPFVTEVDFADNSTVKYTYEEPTGYSSAYTTARLASITNRKGGLTSFSYSGFDCTAMNATTMTKTTTDGVWTYTWTPVGTAPNYTGNITKVTDPAGNVQVYTFSGYVAASTNFYSNYAVVLNQVIYKQGATALKTVTYCHNANVGCGSGETPVQLPITTLNTYTLMKGMNRTSRTATTYDNYGNLLTRSDYDYGATTPSFVTTTSYGSWNGTACVAVGSGITNAPCETVRKDAANNILSDTRVTYDAHGNSTKTQAWSGTRWLVTSATYNPNGTVATHTDTLGNITTITYGNCNGAFPTKAQTGSYYTQDVWNCDGGVPTSVTDENGNVTNYGYILPGGQGEPFWRATSVTDALGTVTNTSYTPTSTSNTRTFGSSTESSFTGLDSFGRVTERQVGSSSDNSTVTIGYNTEANSSSVSVPCNTTTMCPTGFTSTINDAAGRVSLVLGGGGSTTNVTYTGIANSSVFDTTTTIGPAPAGENVKTIQTESDGFGRVLSTCAIEVTGGAACGQVASGSGVLTSNAYSTSASGTTITNTRGAETKTTVLDELGRVTSRATPEAGTTQYLYDVQDAACGSYSMIGYLAEVKYANGQINCYGYDYKGRLSGVGHTAGLPCQGFVYDAAVTPPTGVTVLNGAGKMVEAYTNSGCAGHSGLLTDEWFSYDALGRLTDVWEKTPHSSGYYHASVTHFANGKISSLSIPGYPTITYTLDSKGRPFSAAVGSSSIIGGAYYGPVGVTQINISVGGDADTYTYDSNTGLPTSYTLPVTTCLKCHGWIYGALTWNTDGTLASLATTDAFNSPGTHTCAFSYDDLARLSTDSCTGGTTWSQTYSYDQYNNLTKGGSASFNPGYNTKNQYSGIGATYDASGNITYDAVNYYSWDSFGKMTTVATGGTANCGVAGTCITYDALGRAVEKSSGSVYSGMLYSPVGMVETIASAGNTAEVPTPGGSHAVLMSGGSTIQYWHTDWLGTVRLASDVLASSVVYDRAFAPYGDIYLNFGATSFVNFTGDTQVLYPSSTLLDTPNRELNTAPSRWLTPDPAFSGWNAYALPTNPNSVIDPSGLQGINFLNLHQGEGALDMPDMGDLEGWNDAMSTSPAENSYLTPTDGTENAAQPSSSIGATTCSGMIGCSPSGTTPPRTNMANYPGHPGLLDPYIIDFMVGINRMEYNLCGFSGCTQLGLFEASTGGFSLSAGEAPPRAISAEARAAIDASPLTGGLRGSGDSELASVVRDWTKFRASDAWDQPEGVLQNDFPRTVVYIDGGMNQGAGGELNPAQWASFDRGTDPFFIKWVLSLPLPKLQ